MTFGRPLPLALASYTASSALGLGLAAQYQALVNSRSGLRPGRFASAAIDTWFGEVADVHSVILPPDLRHWDCRNNRLGWLALQQDGFIESVQAAKTRFGAARIATFMGTSTAGIAHTEQAYAERAHAEATLPDWYEYRTSQNCASVAEFTRAALGLTGISTAISTACSSSAKVFASAARALEHGLCDAAVVGGVDSLCLMTFYGFNALQLISPEICRPADAQRRGINIGEAGGFALLMRAADAPNAAVQLLGYGESSDAYHMSTPAPDGSGAAAAMRDALGKAGLSASAIDYVNLHGTGTPANDSAEDAGMLSVFGRQTPCSSTKGFTGHTLGAAGILEALFSALTITHGFMPASLNTQNPDPQLQSQILLQTQQARVLRVLSNSFGFGGSNCSLILGAA